MRSLYETFTSLDIFRENDAAITFLLEHDLLKHEIKCQKFKSNDKIRIMKIYDCLSYLDGKVYRCLYNKFRNRLSLKIVQNLEI
jgi:hypothetical protein